MSERPDFERVLAEHECVSEAMTALGVAECACGWEGQAGETYRAHLTAALNAEVARVVAAAKAEALIEAAEAFGHRWQADQIGSATVVYRALRDRAAALAPTPTTADEKGTGR